MWWCYTVSWCYLVLWYTTHWLCTIKRASWRHCIQRASKTSSSSAIFCLNSSWKENLNGIPITVEWGSPAIEEPKELGMVSIRRSMNSWFDTAQSKKPFLNCQRTLLSDVRVTVSIEGYCPFTFGSDKIHCGLKYTTARRESMWLRYFETANQSRYWNRILTLSFVVYVSNQSNLLSHLELLVKAKHIGSCLFASNFFCCAMSIIIWWLSRHSCHLPSAVLSFASNLKCFLWLALACPPTPIFLIEVLAL